jgi:N-acetylmuramoyl-L-alanine amidase
MYRILLALLLAVLSVVLTGCATSSRGVGRFNTVVLDAGHGGHDPGAKGADRVSREKIFALDTAKRIERGLKARGYRVIMTRKGDYFVSLPQRVQMANKQRRAVFVSVHYNWSRRTSAAGTETFYHNSRSYPLAANIQREVDRASPMPNRGVKRARFHVLRNNTKPSALVELGFMSNTQELKKIKSAAYRQKLADAVVRGIVKSSQ